MNLLEMTLQGGVLILVILLLRGLLRYRLPGWTFRILWGVALVRLLVPLTLPSQWSVYTGLDRLADRAETVQTAPAPQPGPSVIWTAPSEEPSHSDVPAAPSEPVPAPVPEGAAQTVPVKVPWHIVLWGTGAGLLALAFAVSYGRNVAVFRTALPLTHPAINRWRQCYPVLRGVPIRRCDRIRSPLTYGLVRPVVLLPKGLDCDDTQELGYVLLHEGAHIRHRDAWWKLFLAAALCVHWFNPLVWCMYVCANRDLERCCDESVVRACGLKARSEYALTLLKWEERRSGLLPLCSPFSNRIMKERVTFIMKLKQQSVLLCKQAAKNFHTICKKETALKRVLSNLLSAVSLLRFKAVFSCGFRVPPGSGLYQSCAAGSVCIPAGQKYCSPRPRKSCPADRKTLGLPSRCIGHRW